MNIVEILKNVSRKTKFYSPAFGMLTLVKISEHEIITLNTEGGDMVEFFADGKYDTNGEVMLFPSKEMHDWDKFAWQKGDVLSADLKKVNVIFEEFTDNTLKFFKGRHWLEYENRDNVTYNKEGVYCTKAFTKADDITSKCYIDIIEKRLNGTLDAETLEVVKPRWIPKPFDKVITYDNLMCEWSCNLFSHIQKNGSYVCVGGIIPDKILSYNEETAKLIGTSNEYKENA